MTGQAHKSATLTSEPAGQASPLARGAAPSPARRPPGPDSCGDFALRIARDGRWFYHGSPIDRKSLVRLFASVLRREADGGYWLVTPAERGRIEVDDAPFVAVGLAVEGAGAAQRLRFRTNLEDEVVADAAHPIRVVEHPATGEPAPYVMVRDGLEARLSRAVFYDLVERGEERAVDGATVLGVWSAGTFFALGRVA